MSDFPVATEVSISDVTADFVTSSNEVRDRIDQVNSGSRSVEFKRITSSELANSDVSTDFLVEDTMVAGQPMIIAGPAKTLKTTTVIDAAISLASGTPMLGRFKVSNAVRVAVMSGESGLGTIKETAQRVAKSKSLCLDDLSDLVWSPELPKLGDTEHMEALQRFLITDGIEVLFIDPAYLCMSGENAGNLMSQGELLGQLTKTCSMMGVTPVLVHHTKKETVRSRKPLGLADIAWAGFSEFARQWWMVSRRDRYKEGSGNHKLWLSVGGSAGHSALWEVDAKEGVYNRSEPRQWDVSVNSSEEVRIASAKAKAKKRNLLMQRHGRRIRRALWMP